MTDYTKSTTFSAKDALPSGHPSKKILGSLFDTEFDNISVAISTKLETGDSASFASGTTVADVTFTAGTLETASPVLTLNNDVSITGNITVSGTVDGRDVATDGAKLDGIEAGATGDQTAAEIKTAYESNADTNAYTDAEKTKLGTVETGADVTDATNVDAAGAVMNSDATTASMSFVIDEDTLASNLDTKVPTQQSVKAYVDATVVAIGGLTIDEPVATGEFGVFTSASTIGGQTPAQVRASLDLEVGTDVQAHDADLDAIAALTPTDGHFLQYSGGTWVGAEVQTDPTLATLTKTFTTNEQSTITLSSSLTGAPVVSVTKEVPQVGVSSGAWDVNSTIENYTRTNSAPATTLDFLGYNISGASYTSTSLSVTQEASPRGMTFNNDGTKLFVCGTSGDDVNEYTLSTAYDITTTSFVDSFLVNINSLNPQGLAFNTDGTKMFVVCAGNDNVAEYTLSTGFDVSTASYSQAFSVASQESDPWDIAFNTDGTKMFIAGNAGNDISEYTLSTGFDVSTASFVDDFRVASEETNVYALEFSPDGYFMFVGGSSSDTVHKYALSTAFDVSTASLDSSFSVASQSGAGLSSIMFNADGTKLFVGDFNNATIFEYDVPIGKAILGTGSFASADVGKTIEANSGKFILTATDGSIAETTAPTSYNQVASGDWEMYAVVYNTTDGDLELSSFIDGYDVAGASYDSVSFSVASQETLPRSIAFNTDGTKMFVIGETGDDVNEYTLSTAFDVSTATFVDAFSVSSQDIEPQGINFNNDGTKMFVVGDQNNGIYEYALSTAFDVSTASFTASTSVTTTILKPFDLAFNNDGTKVFILDEQTKNIYEYTMSTAFSVSTMTLVDGFNVNSQDSQPSGFDFNSDGTKMFMVGFNTDKVYQYSLSTAFDISTASYDGISFSVSSQDFEPRAVRFNTDGTKMFIVGGAQDSIFQYSTGEIYNTTGYHAVHTTASTDSTYWTDINSMTVDEDAGDGNVYYAVSTDDRTTWSVIDDTDGVRDIVRNSGGTWEYNSNSTYGSETWTAGTTNTELATLEEAMSGAIGGFNLAAASYSQNFSVASQDAVPTGVAFNTDGTKMFVTGSAGTDVNEYILTTGFDVSTASYSQNFSVISQGTNPRGLAFNSDGTKMFVVDQAGSTVYEYDLTTGFDVSTASYSSTSFSLASQETGARDLAFNADGTKMFITGTTGADVNEYALTTGFDVSTASFTQNFSVSSQDVYPVGIAFSTDGTSMFILGQFNDEVFEYTLTAGFDVSTASYSSTSFSVLSQESNPNGLVFSADGTKMFLTGTGGDDVNEYNTGLFHNQMDKTQLEAVTDANHYTLGNDLDLAIVFNQTASGLAPSSDGVSINYDANTLEQGAVLGTDYNWDNPASDKVRITALQAGNYKVRVV